MPILIVTHSRDTEAISLVTRALEQRGERAYRFDTDLYPTEVRLSLACEGRAITPSRSGGSTGPPVRSSCRT